MKELLTSIKRTPYQSLASFLILLFTLFLALFFFNLTSFFNGILGYVETRPYIEIFFQKQTDEAAIFKVRDAIKSSGKSESIEYISQQKALQIYKENNRDEPLLLEMVSADILPPSLRIYAKDPRYLAEIAEFARKQPGVDDIFFQKEILEKLLSATTTLKRISLFVLVFLVIISFGVLMTTAAFKITLKKQEIELLRLLGASNFYIQKPFLIEGALFGFTSATIAFAFYYLILVIMNPLITSYLRNLPKLPFYSLGGYNLYVWPPSWQYIGLSYAVIVIFGIGIGLVGNLLATAKYIK